MYSNIKRGYYQEGPNGPSVRRTRILIPLTANQRDYEFEEKSTLERNYLVGLWVTKPGTVVETGKSVAASAIFDSAHITLRVGTTDVVQRLYLHQILAANEQGRPYEISIPDRINMTESGLQVMNELNIAANTVLEIQADYVIESSKNKL